METRICFCAIAAMLLSLITSHASAAGFFESLGKAFSPQDSAKVEREKKMTTIPRCSKPMGTISVAAPANDWWRGLNLQSPEAVIKLFVRQSGCFTLVDRGRGYEAAMRERALSTGGELQAGTEVGKQRIVSAQYVLVPDLVTNNQNAGGAGAGAIVGIIGGLFGIPGAGLAANVQMIDRNATVTLTLTDIQTTEELVGVEGYAEKTDVGFGVGGAGIGMGGFAAAGAGSYASTEAGQIIANAYQNAFIKLIDEYAKKTGMVRDQTEVQRSAPETTPASPEDALPQEEQQQ